MPRNRVGVVSVALALVGTTIAATSSRTRAPIVVTHEVIAVYLGTDGTDGGMVEVVRDMRAALQRQVTSSGRKFISRGVSLEPSVDGGLRHLARLGPFDEVSLGGNWTNSAVVRYLGGDMSNHRRAGIPQVVLLERDVQRDGSEMLLVGPEREIGRYLGTAEIATWVRGGALLPR